MGFNGNFAASMLGSVISAARFKDLPLSQCQLLLKAFWLYQLTSPAAFAAAPAASTPAEAALASKFSAVVIAGTPTKCIN